MSNPTRTRTVTLTEDDVTTLVLGLLARERTLRRLQAEARLSGAQIDYDTEAALEAVARATWALIGR